MLESLNLGLYALASSSTCRKTRFAARLSLSLCVPLYLTSPRSLTLVSLQCNLKPVAMRGVKSYAMLLCASSKDGKEEGGVEFVLPPTGSQAGERVYFEGEKYESTYGPDGNLEEDKADARGKVYNRRLS